MTSENTMQVAVIGAGTMGHALGLVHALGGCMVTVHDINAKVLAQAPKLIAEALKSLQDAGAVTQAEATAAVARISYSRDLAETVATAALIVEAVVEIAAIKRQVFAEIDRLAPPDAIIASNTSYLDVFPLIPKARQARAAIAHWYTPPYLIDLVDIAPGPDTSAETIKTLRKLYSDFGKVPVVFKKLIPGYVANRLQAALNLECLRMVNEGWVSAEEIDQSIRHGLTTRMAILGHMEKMDYTGLEMVRNGIASRMYHPPENTGETPVLDQQIASGRSGVAAGAGFFDYGDTPVEQLLRQRDLQLFQLKTQIRKITGQNDDDHS